jgi:membrane protein required for colicin V production
VVKIVQSLIGNIFDNKILGPLNHTLGFMFGIVEGLVIVGLILFLLTTQNLFNAGGILSGSFFNGIFQSVYGGLNV